LAVAVVLQACSSAPVPKQVTTSPQRRAAPFPRVAPFRLPHTFEPIRYRARLAIADRRFEGHIAITGALSEPASLVWLHAADLVAIRATATQGDSVIPLEVSPPRRDQMLGLRAKAPLRPGEWTLSIDYTGLIHDAQPPTYNRGSGPLDDPPALGVFRRTVDERTYFFTQSEPIYARRIFPCIDEPDRKVPWQLSLDVKSELVAAANTPIVRETAIDHDHKRVEFAETAPLPSYLIAFAVGPFDVVDAGTAKSGTPIRILTLHDRATNVAASARIAPGILDWLETWLQIPYPYGKLDLVVVPHTGWGAMENPGLVTFKREILEGNDGAATIAHELAHQWFGNLVTMAWWDDIWLNESFATFMSEKLVDAQTADAMTGDLVDSRVIALRVLGTSKRIRPSVDSASVLDFRKFAPVDVINRGAALLGVIETSLGPERFRAAVHDYLTAHQNGNVRSADLVDAFAKAAGQPSEPIMKLLDEPMPELQAKVICEGQTRLHVTTTPWPLSMCVAYDRDGARGEVCGVVDATALDLPLPAKVCPGWVMPDAGARGLYRIVWTKPIVDDLLKRGWSLLTFDEQRTVFAEVDDPAAKLAVFVKLASGRSFPNEIAYLRYLSRYVAADLRRPFDAWVSARFGGSARDLHFQLPVGAGMRAANADFQLVDLVATTLDSQLTAEAKPFAMRYPNLPTDFWFAETVLALAASSDASMRDKLFEELKVTDSDAIWRRAIALSALGRVRGIVGVLKADPSLLDKVRRYDAYRLFANVCDQNERKDLSDLFGTEVRFRGVLDMVDRCITARALLDPGLRKWLAKP
jgi:alanyl aminopeptidase